VKSIIRRNVMLLQQFIAHQISREFIFQQDSAPAHRGGALEAINFFLIASRNVELFQKFF